MYTDIYIYIYVYMHVHAYIHIYIYTYTYLIYASCVYTRLYLSLYIYDDRNNCLHMLMYTGGNRRLALQGPLEAANPIFFNRHILPQLSVPCRAHLTVAVLTH